MAARVISIASFFGSIVVMWFLVDRIFDVRTRNLSIIIFSLLPLDVYYSRLIFPDSFSAFLLLSSGLFFLEATRTEKFNVAGRQSVDARWLIAAGFCAGYFLTVGSYRVAPIVATVGLVCITTMFRLMAEDRDLWWKSGLALLGVATPIVFFQSQYSFLDQMLNLAFLFPRQDGAGSIDLDPYYYTYIFVYFFFPIFITLLAYIVWRVLYWKKMNISYLLNSLWDPKIQLMLVASITPALFHTIYALRGIKVISPSLPWIAIFFAYNLGRIPLPIVRGAAVAFSAGFFLIQAQRLSSDMGYRGLPEMAEVAGQIRGLIADSGKGWMLAVSSSTIDPTATQLVPYWWCEWDDAVCEAPHRIFSAAEFAALEMDARARYEVLSEHELILSGTSAHIARLEGAAMPPGGRLGSFNVLTTPITSRWIIVRRLDD